MPASPTANLCAVLPAPLQRASTEGARGKMWRGGGWEGGSARATQTSHTSTGEPELPELYQPKSSLQYRDFQQPAGILTHQMTSLGAAMQIDAGHKATYRCRKMLPRYMHVEVRHAHVWVGSPVVHNNWLGP